MPSVLIFNTVLSTSQRARLVLETMEESLVTQAKLTSLQHSLKFLDLEDKPKEATHYNENILLGKLLSPRKIRRFKVSKMANRVWVLKGKVETKKVRDNIYKFTFELVEDKHLVFRKRPWSFDGSHLIFKDWLINTSFD